MTGNCNWCQHKLTDTNMFKHESPKDSYYYLCGQCETKFTEQCRNCGHERLGHVNGKCVYSPAVYGDYSCKCRGFEKASI